MPSPDCVCVFDVLYWTCRRSRAAAWRHRTGDSFSLLGGDVTVTHKPGEAALRVSPAHIDPRRDLLVFQDWNDALRIIGEPSWVIRGKPPADSMGALAVSVLSRFVLNPIPMAFAHQWTLQLRLRSTRRVYLVLEPAALEQSRAAWPDGHPWFERYFYWYRDDEPLPGPFMCGAREYYEVPAHELQHLGGLDDFLHLLVGSVLTVGDGQPVYKLMSWRAAG